MKYVLIPIMAFLLIGSVMGAMLPKDVIDIRPRPEPQPEPVVVVVEEQHKSNDARARDECDFDVRNPRCMMHLWDKDDTTMTVNGKEITFDYNYRKAKDKVTIGNEIITLSKSGSFYKGTFEVNGREFEFSKGRLFRYYIKEI